MHADDAAAGSIFNPSLATAKSPYQSLDMIRKWGWSRLPVAKVDRFFKDMYGTFGIGWALDELGVSSSTTDEDGLNSLFMIDHEDHRDGVQEVDKQWYIGDNMWRRRTGASYHFTLNYQEGVIIALNRKSPKYAAAEDRTPPVPKEMLPKLQSFSDIAWLGWKYLTERNKADITNLRYFFTVGIVNIETLEVISRAMSQKHWEAEDFPGHTFEPTDAEFSALLGTPNIQGFAYFLIQHKEQLGNMFISKIQVFIGLTRYESPCVLMHVSKARSSPTEEPTGRGRRDSGVELVRTHTLGW
ncbi:hypothetical protein NX059_011950 [Plenodomus lindquistii]|nr:hypothetical protein NX059_011950 [Plenodomus lindquistii]